MFLFFQVNPLVQAKRLLLDVVNIDFCFLIKEWNKHSKEMEDLVKNQVRHVNVFKGEEKFYATD